MRKLIYIFIAFSLTILPAQAFDDSGCWDDFDEWWIDLDEVVVYPEEDYDWGLGITDDWWVRDEPDNDEPEEDEPEEDLRPEEAPKPDKPNNGNDETPPTQGKEKILDSIIKELEKKTGLKVNEVRIGERTARAYVDPITGQIYVCEGWFVLGADNQMSVIYHEMYHAKNDFPVGRDQDGNIIQIPTGEPIQYTDREIERFKEICRDGLEDLPLADRQMNFDLCMMSTETEYFYVPSNFSLNEIKAYESQLEGERNGWWTHTDEERKEIQDRIAQFSDSYDRAIDYENKHNLNSRGTPK